MQEVEPSVVADHVRLDTCVPPPPPRASSPEAIPLLPKPSPSAATPDTPPPCDDARPPPPAHPGHHHQRAALFHLLLSNFLFTTAVTLTVPVRPTIILDAAGGDASSAAAYSGLVDSLQALLGIVLVPLLGAASDVTGRRPIYLLCHFGEFAALLAIARFTSSLLLQLPGYLLLALTGAYFVVTSTIIADLARGDTQRATAYFGYNGAVHGVSFLVGPPLGGLLEKHLYRIASFHVALLLICCTVVYVYFFLPETLQSTSPLYTEPEPGPGPDPATTAATPDAARRSRLWRPAAPAWWTALRRTVDRIAHAVSVTNVNPIAQVRSFFDVSPAMRWLALSIATASLAQSGLLSFFFLYLAQKLSWGAEDTGYFISALGLTLIVSQAVLAPLTMRLLGERGSIVYATFMHAVHFSMYALVNSTPAVYLALFVGMFSFVYEPALKAVLCRQVTADKQGALQGSLSALRDVVKPVGPLIATALFGFGNHIGFPALPFYCGAVIFSIAGLFAIIAFGKRGMKI